MKLTIRHAHIPIILATTCLLGFGYFLQDYKGILPCPLCIFQRIAFAAIIIFSIIAWAGYRCSYARITGWIAALLFSIAGTALAMRQTWLQHQGVHNATCLPGLHYLFTTFPFFKAMMLALQGSSDCAKVQWRFIGMSIAQWSMVCFILLSITFIVFLARSRRAN